MDIKKSLSQNKDSNKLNHINLMYFESSMALSVKETIRVSSRKT